MKRESKRTSSQNAKVLLLAFALLLFCSFVPAQQFNAGLLAGISTSQVDGDTYAGYHKLGLYAGGFVTKKISASGKWSASFEITYIQKGSRKTPNPDKGDPTLYILDLNYAEVPLLLKYAFTVPDSLGDNKMKFQIESGAAIGALVKSKEENAFGPVVGVVPFEKASYSYILGLNYFASGKAAFNIRYEYSIVPVRKGATGQYYQNWTYKILRPGYYNNQVLLSFRYQL